MFDVTGKMTPKENYLRLIKGDGPEYLCHNAEYSKGMFLDPLVRAVGKPGPGGEGRDCWGVYYKWPAGEPGPVPFVTDGNKVIKDITKWETYLSVPRPSQFEIDWTDCDRRARNLTGIITCF